MFYSCNSGDKLRVYIDQPEPYISSNARASTQICGNFSTMLSHSFYSTTGVLMLELETDENPAPHRGFKGRFNYIDAGRVKFFVTEIF